jgi:hypothetical protein
VGSGWIWWVLALTAMVGGVVIILQSAWQGRTRQLFRNCAMVAINVVNIGRLGMDHVKETGRTHQAIKKTLPYAVSIWIATILTLFTPLAALIMGR